MLYFFMGESLSRYLFMTESLSKINPKSKGLRGFVRDLGYGLEKELVDKFDDRVEKHDIDVRFHENCPNQFFQLFWFYTGSKYYFSGEFSLNKPDDNFEVTIDRSLGVVIYIDSNWTRFKASPTELRIAADMEETVQEFFDARFGNPLYESGDRLTYRTDLPEEFRSD